MFSKEQYNRLFVSANLLFLFVLLASCSEANEVQEDVEVVEFTSQPTLVETGTPGEVVLPTLTTEATPAATLEPVNTPIPEELFLERVVNIPPSLMLHSAYYPHTEDLAIALVENGYTGLTYQDYYEGLKNDDLPEKPILISIDDLSPTWLRSEFPAMIEEFSKHGFVGTLGIVTTGTREETKPELWTYYKELAENGWELAIHGEDHVLMGYQSNTELRRQIEEPYWEIFEGTGYPPTTLILPFGVVEGPDGLVDQRIFDICEELGIDWVVGIANGKEIQGFSPFYVGRIGHGKGVDITLAYLENSFE